jgi:peptidoglycan/xylan/chitin deacetylase (PgdA/CDA1 family)
MTRQVVLAFHGLGEPPDRIEADERPYWIPVALFEDIVARTAARPDVRYTFDDGNLSDLEQGAPILRRFGRSGDFFVLTGRLEQPGYLSPDDVRRLIGMGMTIGLHGRDHLDWRRIGPAQLIEETVTARNVLAEVCGRPIEAVSIPFGAYNRRVLSHLRDCGYATILTVDGGIADDGEQVRNRTSIRSDMDAATLAATLAGQASPWAQLRRMASTFARRRLI